MYALFVIMFMILSKEIPIMVLSLGKAAELAGYTRLEFIRKLQAENEPIFDYDEALIDEMINSAKTTPHII